jgi:ferredoxin
MAKIIHDKVNCIGCGACAAICPKFWEMGDDGLAHLKGSDESSGKQTLEISEENKKENQDAADVCPVQIITIEE